jgi:aminoglycoside phosphotransferase (APT) family kinase protein
MTQAWTPEHPVNAALARKLVHDQFPELAALEPRRLGQGWDCDVWSFGETAFRFPRRAMGVGLLEAELKVLPHLAPHLDLAIPAPTHVGEPVEDFPYRFFGHQVVPGVPADQANQDEASRAALAPQLGRFLRQLHAIDPGEVRAPEDDFKWDMARKAKAALARLPMLPRGEDLAAVEGVLTDLPPNAHGRTLIHGDVYVRHLMLGPEGLVGVIDWGDVRWGDPAIDLAAAYSFLPPAARDAFWEAYGEVDEATRRRARLTGLANHGVSLLAYALDVGDEVLVREATRSLRYAL